MIQKTKMEDILAAVATAAEADKLANIKNSTATSNSMKQPHSHVVAAQIPR